MSETIYKHVTSTFRIVSGIVLSRLHLQLKSNGVVIKDITITSITARVSWIQNNINFAIVSVSDLNIFTVTLLHSPHYSGFKMVHQLGHSPWSIALVSFDLKVMCLHSASVSIEPRPGQWEHWIVQEHQVSWYTLATSQFGPGCKTIFSLWVQATLQVAQLYLGIASSEQTEDTVPSSIYIKSTWESASVV